MGCSISKLDNEEAVQLCKDRKKFIKQAVEHRMRFVSGHIAYIRAMRIVSAALREYIDGDDLDSFTTPIFTPVKETNPGCISNSFKSETKSSYKVNYYRSGGNASVSVEERPPVSPQTHRVEAYSPIHHFGMDSMFAISSPMRSPNNRPKCPSPSPQTSQWDFWDPFSSLDYYRYAMRDSLDQAMMDDEKTGLQQVQKEEGAPKLEMETEYEDIDEKSKKEKNGKPETNVDRKLVVMEDGSNGDVETEVKPHETEEHHEESPSKEHETIEVDKAQNIRQLSKKKTVVDGECESKEETPGFTVYVNRRPTSMAEVIMDLEDQFTAACKAAGQVSSISDSGRAQCSPLISDNTAMKILNPVALFRSASSLSVSAQSRFFGSDSTSRDEGYESSSDFSESCTSSASHQSTLDQLYAWENKLYNEVRAGTRVRLAYEKKCSLIRNHDVKKGEDPSFVDKTRAAIRDLQTQIKVSLHSVEAISKKIESLRDDELEPQVLELVQGLARMWKAMAECHQIQRFTLDEAKVLLALRSCKHTIISHSEPHKMATSAANLETELKNWRSSFEAWIVSQRSYVHALTAWLSCCVRSYPDSLNATPALFNICIQWSKLLDSVHEASVVHGIDFFATGVGSLQLKEGQDEVMTAEVAVRVLYAGMSVAVGAVTEFAGSSAEGYVDLIKQWENK